MATFDKRARCAVLFGLILPTIVSASSLSAINPILVNRPSPTGESLVLNIDILQIQSGYLWADVELTASNFTSPGLVTIISSHSEPISSSIGPGSLTALATINFSSWSQTNGASVSGRLERILLLNTTSAFPDESSNFMLFIGTNLSAVSEFVHSTIPTYEEQSSLNEVSSSTISQSYGDIPTIQNLFHTFSYVYVSDITIDHSYDFQTFAKLVALVPWLLMALSLLLLFIAILRPRFADSFKLSDYLQIFLTLLLFVPISIFSTSQLIPPGDSVFLTNWLSTFAFDMDLSFFVIVASTFLAVIAAWARSGT